MCAGSKYERLRHGSRKLCGSHTVERHIQLEIELTCHAGQHHRSGGSIQIPVRRGEAASCYREAVALRHSRKGKLCMQGRCNGGSSHIGEPGGHNIHRFYIARFGRQLEHQPCATANQVVERDGRVGFIHRSTRGQRSGIVHAMPHRYGVRRCSGAATTAGNTAATAATGSSSRFRGKGIEIIGTGTQQQRMHRRQAAIARRGSVCAFAHVFIRLQIGRLSYAPESEDTQRCVVRQRRRSTRGDLHANARCREMHCKTFTLPQQKTAFRTRTKQQDCRQVFYHP